MNKSIRIIVALALTAGMTAFAADENDAKPAKPTKGAPKKAPASLADRTIKRYEAVGLTEEQKTKIQEAAKVAETKMTDLKSKAALTDAQRQAQRDAVKAAKDAGKTPKEVKEASAAATQLSDAQIEAQKQMKAANAEFNKAVSALLTDEQKTKLKESRKKKAAAKPATT